MPGGLPEGVSPFLVFETMNAYQKSSALRAAVDLNLFTAIGEGCSDVAAIAKRCGASERGIRILSDYLVIIGLLEKRDGRYFHTPTSAAFLDPKSPACVAAATRFMNDPEFTGVFNHMADIVRNGRTALPGEGTVSAHNPVWVEFARSMAPMMRPLAGPLGAVVLSNGPRPMKVLDIAAGHGIFGIEVARQNPQARITALDWPAVLEVAKENAHKAGVGDRYETLAGDAFEVAYGGPYDVVLLTNFLHHYDWPACVNLLRKVRAALVPGGQAAALEFVPNDDRVSPPAAAAFSLIMLVTTKAGDAYTYRELDGMYREAGFTRTTEHAIPMSPHKVVVGMNS